MPYYRNAFVLDDDPVSNFILENTLEENQIADSIRSFTRYRDLLKEFTLLADSSESEDGMPDLLLLDLHLNEVDGLEVMEQLLNIPGIGGSRVCVFLMSVSLSVQWLEKAKEYPLSGVLIKPIGENELSLIRRSGIHNDCLL